MNAPTDGTPRRRWRTPIAAAVMLVFIAVYILVVWQLSFQLPDHWLAHVLYYPIGGMAWIVPVRYLMRWAARDDQP